MSSLYAWPGTTLGRASLLALLASGLGVWVSSPLLWGLGPVGWLCLLWGMASAESAYDPTICGDDGGSCGLLQIRQATCELVGLPDADVTSPYDAAQVAGAIVSHAIRSDIRWAAIYLPFARWPMARALWTHGEAGGSLANGLSTVLAGDGGEVRGLLTYGLVRGTTLGVGLLACLALRVAR